MIELTRNIPGLKGIVKAETQRKTLREFEDLFEPAVFQSALIVRKLYKDVKVGAKPSDVPKK